MLIKLIFLCISFSTYAVDVTYLMKPTLDQFNHYSERPNPELCDETPPLLEPDQWLSLSIDPFIKELRTVSKSVTGFESFNAQFTMHGEVSGRYLYSTRWGWIDLTHLSAAAAQSTKYPVHVVLSMGEALEFTQMASAKNSSWSYEDLTSNLLGTYFPAYVKETKFPPNATFVDKIEKYLKDLGCVNEPLKVAPNRERVPLKSVSDEMYNKVKPTKRNYGYKPLYALPDQKETELDKKIRASLKIIDLSLSKK